LLVDADDTLWENNVHFLHVTDRFFHELDALGVQRDLALETLHQTELRNIPRYGYGSRSYARSIEETFAFLAPHGDSATVSYLSSLAAAIFERDTIDLLPRVPEALERLSEHHRLILVTKGDEEEQRWKLACSGLAGYFAAIEVVPEKNEQTYRELMQRWKLDPERTWMIGNSPKSDINPALAAGMHAVLVPHAQTWTLELEEIDHVSDRLIVVDSLWELATLFVPSET